MDLICFEIKKRKIQSNLSFLKVSKYEIISYFNRNLFKNNFKEIRFNTESFK
jgi:hypothetical protein